MKQVKSEEEFASEIIEKICAFFEELSLRKTLQHENVRYDNRQVFSANSTPIPIYLSLLFVLKL